MVLEKNNYAFQKNLGHFVFARNITWIVVGTTVLVFFSSEIQDDEIKKGFLVGYQFYVLFAIYAYMQLLEGLKYVRYILNSM